MCNRGICETSGCIRGNFGVLFRCVGAVCALVALSVSSSLSFFSAFVHFGDFCRGEGTQIKMLFKICLHILFCCGGAWFDDVGRSGGLPTEGLRGNPLTIP